MMKMHLRNCVKLGWYYILKRVCVCANLSLCPHMELSYDSPCACGIIHEAVMLSYVSIKHHLQLAGARMEKERERGEAT